MEVLQEATLAASIASLLLRVREIGHAGAVASVLDPVGTRIWLADPSGFDPTLALEGTLPFGG